MASTENENPEVNPTTPLTRVSRRTTVKAAILAAVALLGSLNDKPQSNPPTFEEPSSLVPENGLNLVAGWIIPSQVTVNSESGTKSITVTPLNRELKDSKGQVEGSVIEVPIPIEPGAKTASIQFTLNLDTQHKYHVATEGWHSWSTSAHATKIPFGLSQDQLVGGRLYEQSLDGESFPFWEPGKGREKIASNEGRSYGWVSFRNQTTGENTALGVIPSLKEVEKIRYKKEGNKFVVRVEKDLEGINHQPLFKIFLGQNNPRTNKDQGNYSNLLNAFSQELSSLNDRATMNHRVIGFSWPVYGQGVTQEKVGKEIVAGKDIFDTYVIDDGWETFRGSLTFDQKKFPDIKGLIEKMRIAGIKPGIWLAPFMTDKAVMGLPMDWFMEDPKTGIFRAPIDLPRIEGDLKSVFQKPYGFDISNPQFRTYLSSKFVELADMGFEVFKVDFLAVPFTGELKGSDKSPVEYYRQTFGEIRQAVRRSLNKEIEFIGCGAPMMESIGLFEGLRFTWDSAFPNIEPLGARFGKLGSTLATSPVADLIMSRLNTGLYHDAIAVAAKRILMYQKAHGLILDGIHLNDKGIPLDREKQKRSAKTLIALSKNLGISNLFIGDSMTRIEERERNEWKEFVRQFK